MMRKFQFLIGFLLLSFVHVQAQTVLVNITGKVEDSIKKPLDGATVVLVDGKNAIVKTAIANEQGQFMLERIKQGNYKLSIALTGFNKFIKDIIVTGNEASLELGTLILQRQTNEIADVTVTAQKPMVERKVDRTVVNVDAMISSAGSSVLDVLEKSPGVSVDQNGVISLKGKSGVVVFIDDKPTYLSGADLESYLRSLPSSTIDQIELITNPPAKYDAAGGAGVINIRTKRTKVKGFNGALNLAYTQGKYSKTNNSFNFNYRNNKFNSFATVSYNYAENFSDLDINRYFKNADGSRRYDFLQNTYIRPSNGSLNAKLGADYYATDKTTFGIVLTGVARDGSRNNENASKILNAAYSLDSTIVAHNTQDNRFSNGGINANYRHLYKKGGPELTADLDYINYSTGNKQVFNNAIYLSNGSLSSKDRLDGDLPASINIYSAKIDYSHPFANGFKTETGFKISHTETDNVANYFYTANNVTAPDYDKTNHFLYKESIYAAYVNANREFKRWSMQLGLRAEHTVSDGKQLGNLMKPDSSFKRDYTSVFPTAYISYKLDSIGNHVLVLDYGKRINRPYYQDLNPFLSPLDKFTYYVGNPFLQPAFTHNIELSYSYKSLFTIQASYSHTKNNSNETIEIVNGTYFSRPANIGRVVNKSISLQSNIPVAKWFTLSLYTELTNIHSKTDFYTGPLNTQGTFWFVQPNMQFKLGKGWNAQIDGYYQNALTSNQFVLLERGRVNAGVSKKINAALTARATFNDISYSNINRGIINNLSNTQANWRNANDSRTVTLAFSWRFGKAIKDQRRHNASGAQSEQNRVKD